MRRVRQSTVSLLKVINRDGRIGYSNVVARLENFAKSTSRDLLLAGNWVSCELERFHACLEPSNVSTERGRANQCLWDFNAGNWQCVCNDFRHDIVVGICSHTFCNGCIICPFVTLNWRTKWISINDNLITQINSTFYNFLFKRRKKSLQKNVS